MNASERRRARRVARTLVGKWVSFDWLGTLLSGKVVTEVLSGKGYAKPMVTVRTTRHYKDGSPDDIIFHSVNITDVKVLEAQP